MSLDNKNKQKNIVKLGNVCIGAGKPVIIAGPCAVESEEQINDAALSLKKIGVDILRGGCFKPRTSPYTFQGLEEEGIKMLSKAGKENNLPVISEVITIKQLEFAYDYLDIIQIGSRNMYNYPLLKELGTLNKPVLLKRAFSATYDEWIFAAKYILNSGNDKVILCERGIRTFEQGTRNTLDISAVPYISNNTNFPIIIDPSHASGYSEFIKPLSLAAIAAGADGLMIEAHPEPKNALCDARQSLNFDEFEDVYNAVHTLSDSCANL